MKIIVDNLPSYCGECLFCSDIYYDVCDISKSRCTLSKALSESEECPYLMAIDTYLSEVNHG